MGAVESLSRWLAKQDVAGRVRGHRPLVITFRADERHDPFLGPSFNRQRPATRLAARWARRLERPGRSDLLLWHLMLRMFRAEQQHFSTAELAEWQPADSRPLNPWHRPTRREQLAQGARVNPNASSPKRVNIQRFKSKKPCQVTCAGWLLRPGRGAQGAKRRPQPATKQLVPCLGAGVSASRRKSAPRPPRLQVARNWPHELAPFVV